MLARRNVLIESVFNLEHFSMLVYILKKTVLQIESARLQLAALRRNNYKTGQDGVKL